MAAKAEKITFELAIARLEEVVRELEGGQLPLERALELFAEGIEHSRICNERLTMAEQRIAILTANEKGDISLKEIDAANMASGGKNGGF
ncbi:MAG: exodeoxyribonuclease VII small subunit [Desulfotomaculaceae bacterium]|nr:exodeoxyribonuclease VII small subunit [Desulfotomaculaceae bacterium]